MARGDSLLSPGITRALIEAFIDGGTAGRPPCRPSPTRIDVLTDREKQVLAMVAKGVDSEIATGLYVSPAR